MKKFINALICAMMILGLSGCGSSGNEKESDVQENNKSSEKLPLEIMQSGYFVTESPNVMYGVIIKNPNTEYAVDFPTITITMYKEDGSILGTDDQVLNKIAPGDTLAFGGQADPNGQVPSKVEFSLKKDDANYDKDKTASPSSVFKISNTNALKDDYSASFTGEIENTAEKDFSSVAVTVILKKGNDIVYGATTYVDNLAKGSKTPFEVKCFSKVPEYDSFEVYAQSWGYND